MIRRLSLVLVVPSPGHQAGAPLRRPGQRPMRRPRFSTSPGHQAGAPLRRRGRRRGTSRRRGLPPAIRPGLHCGDAGSQGWQRALYGFPRPSGRGSIAARSRMAARWGAVPFPRPSGRGSIAAAGRRRHIMPAISTSPGHQAGAPLRRVSPSLRRQRSLRLPPAIRPGLHCGASAALSSEHQSELPPAIRPGLHCGGEVRPERCAMCRGTSPGHQAGAPLRQRLRPIDPPGLAPGLPPAIRPGLHCGWSS